MKKKRIIVIVGIIILICISIPLIINRIVINKNVDKIISVEDVVNLTDVDAILVLGCQAYKNGPSAMLKYRLDKAMEVYNLIDTKLLLSGDHGHFEYDEVNTMRDYVLKYNISSEDIFMDHAGFSTYDSIYRAINIFETKKIIIVTQEYHLYRSLLIASKLGLDAYGVAANDINGGQLFQNVREFLARNKDYIKVRFKPKSSILGDKIPISGNGNITVD